MEQHSKEEVLMPPVDLRKSTSTNRKIEVETERCSTKRNRWTLNIWRQIMRRTISKKVATPLSRSVSSGLS